jgi:hypothetical protein
MEVSDIQTEGNQMFNVPNTEEGREFIKQLRKFSNNKKFRARGRGSRKRCGDAAYVPLVGSEWMAVYEEKSDADKEAAWKRTKARDEAIRDQERALILNQFIDGIFANELLCDLAKKKFAPTIRAELEEKLTDQIRERTEAKVRRDVAQEILDKS